MEKLKKEIQFVVDIYKSGDLSKAETLCQNLIINNSKVAFLYNLMGLILSAQKNINQAEEYYKKGLKIDAQFAMIYNNLGLLYFENKSEGHIKKAENYYKKSISINNKIPEPYTNLGSLYNSLSKFQDAIDCYKKALLNNPKFAYAHHNLGNIHVSLGNFVEAKKHFYEAIKSNPNFYLSHRTLSRLINYKDNDKHLNQLIKIYKQINSKDIDYKANIGFALGKAYEDIKDYDKSFNYYKEANDFCRKNIKFSLDFETKRFAEIKKIFNKDLFTRYTDSGYEGFSPIFIVGMPRSGTTLVEQILSSHPKVFGADEVEFIPELLQKNFGNNNLNLFFKGALDFKKENFEQIGKDYVNKINKYSNNSERTTDKLTKNFQAIGFIKLVLPKSIIIHCHRNPMDNCFSIFKNHFPGGKIDFAYDLDEIVNYYNLYSDLMKNWNKLFPNFIFNIKYENLISNTKFEIKNLLKKCNLEWSDKCLNFHSNKRPIRTASDTQARKKIYKSSINSWKRYEKYLSSFFSRLKIS